ncbi:hypothetical protein [Sphingosinicella rhizophila]|uniref:Uncharacterized protein n=1 Tax=Sphingosinicella rhizophila TaxID=3050082 RepID=A0ABU3Q9C2_9SPHN|nr:hypothetical protein [Sphingosinicella sp. GR2756]MDT9600005.1 hypothetical protein [Sphingosinicella sp. GR2756]
MLRWWTIKRATGIGVTAAVAALIFWPLHESWTYLVWPQLLLAGLAGLSGVSIIFITLGDLRLNRHRSSRLRPLRIFDLAVATLLIALAYVQMDSLWGQLPAHVPAGDD